MGIEYSVYTVLQASRRAWRLGQEKPVKVYFFVYENTLQYQAIKLVAAKVGAALRVNGDAIPDDSLAELDELAQTDMVNALTEMLLKDEDFTEQKDEAKETNFNDLQSAFHNAAQDMENEESFIGDYDVGIDEYDLPEAHSTAKETPAKVKIDKSPFITQIETEKELNEALILCAAMLSVLRPFTNPSTARDELMSYKVNKKEQFKQSIYMTLYAGGYGELELDHIYDAHLPNGIEMVDLILAKEEVWVDDGEELLGQFRYDELDILVKQRWHESRSNVEPELESIYKPPPQVIQKPIRLTFGISKPPPRKKKKIVPQGQLSFFTI